MSRLLLILAVAAGVTVANTDGHAAPAKSAKGQKTKRSKSQKTKRTAASTQPRANMPRGYTWPPSRSMRGSGKRCEASLTKLGVKWKRTSREGRIAAPIVVPSMKLGGIQYTSTYRKAPHKMDCHLALVLAQVGPKLRSLGVREVKFGSLYRWSNVRVNGTTKPFLSRHALGVALDVVSFVDDQGRAAVVARDYTAGDSLLLDIEDTVNRSGKFRTVLTPANDPASHDDHFHLEVAVDYGKR